jgi:hypothetical protein
VLRSMEEAGLGKVDLAGKVHFETRIDKLKNGENSVYNPEKMEHFEAFWKSFEKSDAASSFLTSRADANRFRVFQKSISPVKPFRTNNMIYLSRLFICGCGKTRNQNLGDNNFLSRAESLSEPISSFQRKKNQFNCSLVQKDISEAKSHEIILILTLMVMHFDGFNLGSDEFHFTPIARGSKWNFEKQNPIKFRCPTPRSWDLIDTVSAFLCVSPSFSRLIALNLLLGKLSSHFTFWDAVCPIMEYLNGRLKTMTLLETQIHDYLCSILHEWTISCLINFNCALSSTLGEKSDAENCLKLALLTKQTSLYSICERIALLSYQEMKLSLKEQFLNSEPEGPSSFDDTNSPISIKNQIKYLGAISRALFEDIKKELTGLSEITKEFLMNAWRELFTHFIADTQMLLLRSSDMIFDLDDQFISPSTENLKNNSIYQLGFSSGSLESLILMLYEEVQKLYSKFQSVIPVNSIPKLRPQVWFFPFVNNWIDRQRKLFLNGRVQRSIDEDNWNPVGDSLCSSSLFDVFAMLYRLSERFKNLPYSNSQAIDLARLISRIVQDYARKIGLILNESLKDENLKEMWGWTRQEGSNDYKIVIPMKILSCLNNLQSSWKYLIELVVHIDFEQTLENALHDVDEKKETIEPVNFLEVKWDCETPSIPPEFHCDAAFDEINRLVFQAESGFAYGVKFCVQFIF